MVAGLTTFVNLVDKGWAAKGQSAQGWTKGEEYSYPYFVRSAHQPSKLGLPRLGWPRVGRADAGGCPGREDTGLCHLEN